MEVAPTLEGVQLEAAARRVQGQVARDTGLAPSELARLRDELRDLTRSLNEAEDRQAADGNRAG